MVFLTGYRERLKIEKSRVWVKRAVNEAITKSSKEFIQLLKHQALIDGFLKEKLTAIRNEDYSKLTLEE